MLHTEDYQLGIKAMLVHQLFEAQVEQTPDAVAVEFESQQLTYQQLNLRANALAHYLQALGVKPDVPLGLCLERSPDLIVAVLAILKAGGAYLPLDCAYPADRLQFMLANASAPVLITQSALVDKLPTTGISVVCLDLSLIHI